jgi:hypothetical protein
MPKYRTYIKHSCENLLNDFHYLLPTITDNPTYESYDVYDTSEQAWEEFNKQRKYYLLDLKYMEKRLNKIKKEISL